jgi:hypothetical protein
VLGKWCDNGRFRSAAASIYLIRAREARLVNE